MYHQHHWEGWGPEEAREREQGMPKDGEGLGRRGGREGSTEPHRERRNKTGDGMTFSWEWSIA